MSLTERLQVYILDSFTALRPKKMSSDDVISVIATLNTLGRRINRWYPYINCGGCCVFASIVGEELLKRGIEARIIVGTDMDDEDRAEGSNLNDLESSVGPQKERWNDNGVFFNHVGVELRLDDDVYHYDTDGINPESQMLKQYLLYDGSISVETAKALADEVEGWNECFDRKQIPSLRGHIRRFLAANLPLTVAS